MRVFNGCLIFFARIRLRSWQLDPHLAPQLEARPASGPGLYVVSKSEPQGGPFKILGRLTRGFQGVSLEIPGIVVSLEIPVFRIFSCKKTRKIVKIIPGKPREVIRTWGNLKMTTFFRPENAKFLTRFFDDFPDFECYDVFYNSSGR